MDVRFAAISNLMDTVEGDDWEECGNYWLRFLPYEYEKDGFRVTVYRSELKEFCLDGVKIGLYLEEYNKEDFIGVVSYLNGEPLLLLDDCLLRNSLQLFADKQWPVCVFEYNFNNSVFSVDIWEQKIVDGIFEVRQIPLIWYREVDFSLDFLKEIFKHCRKIRCLTYLADILWDKYESAANRKNIRLFYFSRF